MWIWYTLGSVAALVLAIIIFFEIPYSKTKNRFKKDVRSYKNKFAPKTDVFREEDIEPLPTPVKNFFYVSGFIGKTKMTRMTTFMPKVPLLTDTNKPPMICDYTLNIFIDEPVRLAYIKTSIAGIPFEGYDSTQDGVGFMKGVIAKLITVFNTKGSEMDKGQLLTLLGECVTVPSLMLTPYVKWEPIDDTHTKATINYKGISGSGIFTFDDKGFVKSFETNERIRAGTDGKIIDNPKWSLSYADYVEKNNLYLPSSIATTWHLKDCDLVYFKASNVEFIYD